MTSGIKIHCMQHVGFEGPACIPAWAEQRGHRFSLTRTDVDPACPDPGDFDLLIVLGGPMSVYREDQWPWIAAEKKFIEICVAIGKPVLGICLGAQLTAAALGAVVEANPDKEIGWFDVDLRPAAEESLLAGILPARFPAFHWHGDRYYLPSGAVSLAASAACEEQAFQYGDHVLCLQFHLEATPDWVRTLADRDSDQLVSAPFIQTRDQMLEPGRPYAISNERISRILDRMVERVIGRGPG